MRNAISGRMPRLLLAAALLGCGPLISHAQVSVGPQRASSLLTPKVIPSQINFGVFAIGDVSAAQTVTVRNISSQPVQITGAQLQGPAAGEFQFNLGQATPFTLQPGASETAQVFYAPQNQGQFGAQLVFMHRGPQVGSKAAVALSGTGIGVPGEEYTINCGGPAVTGGQAWTADYLFQGGLTVATQAPIQGAGGASADEAVLQTARISPSIVYHMPLDPGLYDVRLSFAEIDGALPGERVFNVYGESVLKAAGVDLAALVGPDALYEIEFRLFVFDGELKLALGGLVGLAILNGIEVRQVPLVNHTPGSAAFGPVESGSSAQIAIQLENLSGVTAELTEIVFDNVVTGTSEAFTLTLKS